MKNKFKIKSKKLRNSIQNLKFWWFKVYIFLILAVSLSLIGLYILAAVEETPSALKDWLAGKVKIGEQSVVCPDFVDVDMNDLTMKDQCTGLIWARHELPSYKSAGDTTPGYTWDEANASCTALAGGFRLSTVEELMSLIHYRCDDTTCFATAEIASINGVAPILSNGIYWASNDFHESPDWTDPTATPPGTPERDYKRSVNLLNGEVDSPVFGKTMRLNAWCVVARNPEIVEKKYTSVTPGAITNGQKATSGQLKTIYHRQCAEAADCSVIGATACEGVGSVLPPAAACGDGSCNGAETCSDCPADCGACPPAVIPLSVNITSPTEGQQFTQSTDSISMCYSISDSNLVTQVAVKFDNSFLLNTSGTSPNPPGANDTGCSGSNAVSNILGQHTLSISVTDENNVTVQKSVNITVGAANSPPTVSITLPANGATFTAPANITITADAADSDGTITKVEFYQGATKLGEATTSYTWESVPAGTYSLTVKAFDNAGATTTSTAVNITVTAAFSCTGTIPTNASLCTGDDADLTGPSDVTRTAVNYCTATKCEYQCDNGYVLVGGTCVVGKLVFLTSGTWNGNLGGTSGANAKCQAQADGVGTGGTFKAWLSSGLSDDDPAHNFSHSVIPYYLSSGIKVADNWDDLKDGTLDSRISTYISNITLSVGYVWTNTIITGTELLSSSQSTCQNFTSGDSSLKGATGTTAYANAYWTTSIYTQTDCSWPRYLYCFEQ